LPRGARETTDSGEHALVRAGPFEGTIFPDYDVADGLFSLHVGGYRTRDRSFSQKIGWVVTSPHATGDSLIVTGRRLTPPLRTFTQEFERAFVPGLPKPFFASGIAPPTAGCWRLTFRSGNVTGALSVRVRGF